MRRGGTLLSQNGWGAESSRWCTAYARIIEPFPAAQVTSHENVTTCPPQRTSADRRIPSRNEHCAECAKIGTSRSGSLCIGRPPHVTSVVGGLVGLRLLFILGGGSWLAVVVGLEGYDRSAVSASAPVLGVGGFFSASVPHIGLPGVSILLSRHGVGGSLLDCSGGPAGDHLITAPKTFWCSGRVRRSPRWSGAASLRTTPLDLVGRLPDSLHRRGDVLSVQPAGATRTTTNPL